MVGRINGKRDKRIKQILLLSSKNISFHRLFLENLHVGTSFFRLKVEKYTHTQSYNHGVECNSYMGPTWLRMFFLWVGDEILRLGFCAHFWCGCKCNTKLGQLGSILFDLTYFLWIYNKYCPYLVKLSPNEVLSCNIINIFRSGYILWAPFILQ